MIIAFWILFLVVFTVRVARLTRCVPELEADLEDHLDLKSHGPGVSCRYIFDSGTNIP